MKRSWQSILFICVTSILSAFSYDGLFHHASDCDQVAFATDTSVIGQQDAVHVLDLPSGPLFLTVSHKHSNLPFRYYKRFMEIGHSVPALPEQFSVPLPLIVLVQSSHSPHRAQALNCGMDRHAPSRGPPSLG